MNKKQHKNKFGETILILNKCKIAHIFNKKLNFHIHVFSFLVLMKFVFMKSAFLKTETHYDQESKFYLKKKS